MLAECPPDIVPIPAGLTPVQYVQLGRTRERQARRINVAQTVERRVDEVVSDVLAEVRRAIEASDGGHTTADIVRLVEAKFATRRR